MIILKPDIFATQSRVKRNTAAMSSKRGRLWSDRAELIAECVRLELDKANDIRPYVMNELY